MRRTRVHLPVPVMSGTSRSGVQRQLMGRRNTGFQQKSFTLAALHANMRALWSRPLAGWEAARSRRTLVVVAGSA